MAIPAFDQNKVIIDRGKIVLGNKLTKLKNYQRYAITKDGISPRSFPGSKNGIYIANSYEHEYHGWDEEDSQMRTWQTEKRLRKGKVLENNLPGPTLIGQSKADITLITWGSTKLPASQVIADKKQINLLHFSYVWPLNKKAVKQSLEKYSARKTLIIEGNATGQFQTILKQETGFEPTAHLRKYDGRPIYPEEIIETINKL